MDRREFIKAAAGMVATLSVGHVADRVPEEWVDPTPDAAKLIPVASEGTSEVMYVSLYSREAAGPFSRAGFYPARTKTITFPPVTWPSPNPLFVDRFTIEDAQGVKILERTFENAKPVTLHNGDYFELNVNMEGEF